MKKILLNISILAILTIATSYSASARYERGAGMENRSSLTSRNTSGASYRSVMLPERKVANRDRSVMLPERKVANRDRSVMLPRSPIFINPYNVSNKPVSAGISMVKSTNGWNSIRQQDRTYTQPGRKSSGSYFVEERNPFEGTGFGRVRTEKQLYDHVSESSYNQYEYLAMLYLRGDQLNLQKTMLSLQQNGVFDPAKYQAAIKKLQEKLQEKDSDQNVIANCDGGQEKCVQAPTKLVSIKKTGGRVSKPKTSRTSGSGRTPVFLSKLKKTVSRVFKPRGSSSRTSSPSRPPRRTSSPRTTRRVGPQ